MSNIFEIASRRKFRFSFTKGEITTEQLWDLSLTDLDAVAKLVNANLKAVTEDSFVKVTNNSAAQRLLETKLDVLKHIIAVKLDEVEQRQAVSARAAKRATLLEALAAREAQELSQASKDDLLKQLAELDG